MKKCIGRGITRNYMFTRSIPHAVFVGVIIAIGTSPATAKRWENDLPPVISRNLAFAGDMIAIWSPTGTTSKGPLSETATLIGDRGHFEMERSWLRRPTQHESRFWQLVQVKMETSPGKYRITVGGQSAGELEVINRPQRTPIIAALGTPVKEINRHLESGRNVILAGGEWKIDEAIILPRESELRGYGAVITGKTTEYQSALLKLSDRTCISGLTFRPDAQPFPNQTAAFTGTGANNSAMDVTISDCHFIGGHFGIFQHSGLMVQQCKFELCKCDMINSGVWAKCEFRGIGEGEHAWRCANAARLAMIDCRFDGTDRGPILRTTNQCLFAGIELLNINHISNGCELCCIEGGLDQHGKSVPNAQCDDNLFFGWRSSNCVGTFQPFDLPFRRNLMYDFKFEGAAGIHIWGIVEQSGNVVQACHFTGGGIMFNHPGKIGAKNNKVIDCGFIDWRIRPGNQFAGQKFYFERADLPNLSVITDFAPGMTNEIQRVTIQGQPKGRQEYHGVRVAAPN